MTLIILDYITKGDQYPNNGNNGGGGSSLHLPHLDLTRQRAQAGRPTGRAATVAAAAAATCSSVDGFSCYLCISVLFV